MECSSMLQTDEAFGNQRGNSKQYYLIEKRIKHNGSFANYLSENLQSPT